MFREYSTELVQEMWMSTSADASHACKNLVIEDIKTKIWDPTFEKCKHLLESVHDRSIKLVDVDLYFQHFEDRELFLQRLQKGVIKCSEGSVQMKDMGWIRTAVDLMKEYWSLKGLVGAAENVLTLKNKLNLSGDFSLMETIVEEVYNTQYTFYTVKAL